MSVVGVRRNGSNTGVALEDQDPSNVDVSELNELLNGEGKKAAKTGENIEEVTRRVENTEGLEMIDEGRPYPRPAIDRMETGEAVIVGYEKKPLDQGFDEVYVDFDILLEEEKQEWEDMQVAAEIMALEKGYKLDDKLGPQVDWSVMSRDLDSETDTVLYAEDYEFISKQIAEQEFDDVDTYSVEEYAQENNIEASDEEKVAKLAGPNTSLIYMTVSGGTAEKNNLDYREIEGCRSKLGKFTRIDAGDTDG